MVRAALPHRLYAQRLRSARRASRCRALLQWQIAAAARATHSNDDENNAMQAGAACVCRSAAWDAKVVTSAWWVAAQQVRKSTELPAGAFEIRGAKNFLPPQPLVRHLRAQRMAPACPGNKASWSGCMQDVCHVGGAPFLAFA